MKRLPSIRQLQYLMALHHYQHFGRAAEACFVSQSTLSAAITNLEDALDAQLLERDHKTFLFTPLGEEIVGRSRLILESLEGLTEYAQHQSQPMTGLLRMGCIPTIAPFVLSDLFKVAGTQFPKLQLRLREDTTDNLLHALTEGSIDLLLLALPYPTTGLHVEILASDPFKLVLHRDWLEHGFNDDIATWPDESIFLLEREHCLTDQALQGCQVKDQKKLHPFFATSLHTLTQMVNSQFGITFLPQMAINDGILKNTDLVSRAPANKTAHRDIGLAWRTTSHKQPTFKELARLIKDLLLLKCRDIY
jgi:LysR family hydrogen peroxide-inducible transcriptional activator